MQQPSVTLQPVIKKVLMMSLHGKEAEPWTSGTAKEQDGKALDLGNQLAAQNQPILVCDACRGKLQSL